MSTFEGHTPSTTEVRGAFAIANFYSPQDEAHANFDRWLESERARIWDEGARAAVLQTGGGFGPANPYRKGGDA